MVMTKEEVRKDGQNQKEEVVVKTNLTN